ncbi:chemotaxis protein [Chthonobacter albigriseus]|uniref:chemotaxis protein n=1 Tax=Chthonobacter albigriseus TaxID=1683161 RepID=UPI0015EF11A0|nr:chemotaxis protein [Chthonobacter albigriseus]
MSDSDQVPVSLESDYEAIELAVMETAKGRWFLAEYARRHRAADTTLVLDAIAGLEKKLRRTARPDIDRIRLDIGEMKDAIERTKNEIAQIKHDQNDSSRFDRASNELDAIVSQTEAATSEILTSAEKIQEIAWTMREGGIEPEICDALEGLTTTIYMSCSFQDLTGQRTQKVVHVLRYLETRIDAMIEIWGMDADAEAEKADAPAAGPLMEISRSEQGDEAGVVSRRVADGLDSRPDAHLLNGPALEGEGVDQSEVDHLMFDSIDDAEAEAEEDTGSVSDADAFSGFDPIDLSDDAAAFEEADADLLAEVAATEAELEEAPLDAAEVVTDMDEPDIADSVEAEESADPSEAEVISRATEAMEEAIETLQKVSEAVRPEPAPASDAADPLATMSRAERQALFS